MILHAKSMSSQKRKKGSKEKKTAKTEGSDLHSSHNKFEVLYIEERLRFAVRGYRMEVKREKRWMMDDHCALMMDEREKSRKSEVRVRRMNKKDRKAEGRRQRTEDRSLSEEQKVVGFRVMDEE